MLIWRLLLSVLVSSSLTRGSEDLGSKVSMALKSFILEGVQREAALDLFPEEVHQLVPLLKNHFSPNPQRISLQEIETYLACTACEASVDTMLFLYEELNLDESFLVNRLSELCSLFLGIGVDDCRSILNSYVATVIRLIDMDVVNGARSCALVVGGECGGDDALHQWEVDIPDIPESIRTESQASSNSFKFLHLTDIHLDLTYSLDTALENCGNSVLCCTNSSRVAEDDEQTVGYWGEGICDLPDWTLVDTLKHLREEHEDVDFVLLAGDFPAHDLWVQSREANLERTRRVVQVFREVWPNVTVFPAIGNHESFPSNLFPPRSISESDFEISWLYDSLASLYSPWLTDDALESFRENGQYSIKAPGGQVRILTLNTNFCYHFNLWLMLEYEDLGHQLEWLIQQLLRAESEGEKVIINAHVPTGCSSCFGGWGREFARIISRFERTVVGQFYGHTHKNSFYVFYDQETQTTPVNVGFVTPSLTPWENLNPAYSVYSYNDHRLSARETYSFDLKAANAEGSYERPKWRRIFDEGEYFDMENMGPMDYHNLVNRLADDDILFEKYQKIYFSLGTPTEEREEILCNLVTTDSTDLSRCEDFRTLE